MIAIGQRRPDHLRHRVREDAEFLLLLMHPALGALGRAMLGDQRHDAAGKTGEPLGLQLRQPLARLRIDDANGAQRAAIGPA